ncbi:MAG TPA: nitroreductase family protein, partial [Saprospiraceae bacterium]|nr:nitroreductase family protein [Saprospiraceae bacterium]
AIVMESHPHLLPEWEEIASTATAVENMWLMATALGIGSYWSTPGIINHLQPFLSLSDNQKCIGLFYMGYTDVELPASKREDISTKVQWRE